MSQIKKVGILTTLCGGICWGISGCFGQYLFLEKAITAEWLVTIRLILAGALLVAIGLAKDRGKMWEIFQHKQDVKRLLIFSILGMMLCQYTYFAAIEHSNAGTATVLQSLNPLMILAVLCVREKRLPVKIEVAAIACALLGTFLLSTHGNIHTMSLTGTALFLGISSAVTVAIYNLLSGEMLRKYGVYVVVGFGMLIAGAVMTVIVRPWRYAIVWDIQVVGAVFGVVVIGTAIAFALYLKGVSMVGPLMGSLLGSIEPVTAIVVSLMFLGSVFHPIELVGFLLILVTVGGLSLHSGRQGNQ